MTTSFLITTSWDDGHPNDLRVAERLEHHGLTGTFYIPDRNGEGRPVLGNTDIRSLGSHFEVGGHGRDHKVLTGLSSADLSIQLADNKARLEDTLGRNVHGFCYVRGHHNGHVRAAVRDLGYRYARTVRNFQDAAGFPAFLMPVTLQFFPHSNAVYLRNLLRNGGGELHLVAAVLGTHDLVARISAALEAAMLHGRHFHLWGHSWELEEAGLWGAFDEVLAIMARVLDRARPATNAEVASTLARGDRPPGA